MAYFHALQPPFREVVTRVEMITPERAAADLKRSEGKNYRPLGKKWVAALAKDFKARFEFNRKPIEYDEEGFVHDGQHRLHAVVESGLTLPFVVVYGSKPCLSEGWIRRRTMADHLYAEGLSNTQDLAAAIRLVAAYNAGDISQPPKSLSHAELEETRLLCPDLTDYVNMVKNKPATKIVSPSALGAVMYISCCLLAEKKGREIAEEFAYKIGHGTDLDAGNPILVLREKLLANKTHATKKLDRTAILAFIIKAWNAYVAGQSIKKLVWRPDADHFPEIK